MVGEDGGGRQFTIGEVILTSNTGAMAPRLGVGCVIKDRIRTRNRRRGARDGDHYQRLIPDLLNSSHCLYISGITSNDAVLSKEDFSMIGRRERPRSCIPERQRYASLEWPRPHATTPICSCWT